MAISFTPGQVISWDDLNAILAQHGSPQGAKSIVQLPNKPLTDAEKIEIERAGGDPDAARPITIRYFMEDGSYVDAVLDQPGEQTGDGVAGSGQGSTFRVVEYKPSQKYQETQKPSSVATPGSGATTHIEGTPIPGGGFDNERPVKVIKDKDGNPVGLPVPLTGKELEDWRTDREKSRNPGNKTDADLERERKEAETKAATEKKEAEAKAEKEAAANRGTTVLKPDGKGGTIAVTTYPDGRPPTTAPVAGVPSEASNKYREVKQDPTTGKWSGLTSDGKWEPIEGGPGLPDKGVGNIKGLPTFTPDLTKPGAGLIDYAKQLDEFMAANPSFTWEKRQEVLKNAQVLAAQVAGEFNTGAAVLREQYQNETSQRGQDMTQAGNRANLANSHHQNAVTLIEKFAPYLGATPGDAGKLFMGMMASQLATATAYGGMKETPRVQMDPRLTAFADRTVGAATAMPGAAPGVPAVPGAPAPPNALGLGAIGNQPAPGGAQMPPDAEAVPLPAPVGIAPAAPPVRDDWRLGAPIPPAVPGMPSPLGDTGAPPISQVNPAVESLLGNVLPPQPTSWREDAQARASMFEPMNPGSVALGERMLGSALPTQPYGGGFSLGGPVGPAPLALQSAVPGLTPEIDAEARRQLQAELQGVA